MARKTENITIVDADNRTLKFVITQMAAMQLHDFTLRIGFLLLGTDVARSMNSLEVVGQVGAKFAQDGLALLNGLSFEVTKPLLNELLGCCSHVVDTGVMLKCDADTFDGISDDPMTIFKLEMEAAKLNFSFFSRMLGDNSIIPAGLNGVRPGASMA